MGYYPRESKFCVGTRVKVIRQRNYPGQKLEGLVGTVQTAYGNSFAVLLDTVKNPRSSYSYFYFKVNELTAVDEYDDKHEEDKNMDAVTNYRNIARVRYINDRKDGVYQYANFEVDLKANDLCVVRSENDTLMVARVVEIIDPCDIEMYREVVAKVYTEDYDRRVERRIKAAELKSKMETRAKQLQDIALYQMLAKDDSDMAALLQEYQDLILV